MMEPHIYIQEQEYRNHMQHTLLLTSSICGEVALPLLTTFEHFETGFVAFSRVLFFAAGFLCLALTSAAFALFSAFFALSCSFSLAFRARSSFLFFKASSFSFLFCSLCFRRSSFSSASRFFLSSLSSISDKHSELVSTRAPETRLATADLGFGGGTYCTRYLEMYWSFSGDLGVDKPREGVASEGPALSWEGVGTLGHRGVSWEERLPPGAPLLSWEGGVYPGDSSVSCEEGLAPSDFGVPWDRRLPPDVCPLSWEGGVATSDLGVP